MRPLVNFIHCLLTKTAPLNLFLAIGALASCHSGIQTKNSPDISPVEKDTLKKTEPRLKTVLFFGNSLTAGYGLEPSQSFPSLIQQRFDSLQLPYKVINAGVSGETTSGGIGRIDWILKQHVDVFVLELGGNDGLRGIPLSVTKKNLQTIINEVKVKYPEAAIVLAGMQIPPNIGQDYTGEFRKIYPELAEKNHIYLIPFLLKGVGGNPALNQHDEIHPNERGEKIVAENVWNVLKNICR
jgi:acyl-CoA thioesterase I